MSEQEHDAGDVEDGDETDAADDRVGDSDGTGAGDGPGSDLDAVLEDAVDGDVDPEAVDDLDADLVERVADADAESVASSLAALRTRVDALGGQLAEREQTVEDLTSKLKRKQADFRNYKKRTEKRRERERQRATENLVERLLDVRDNLVRALDQEDADADAIRNGVEKTLSEFDRVLEDENVDVVEPEPGEDVDPHTHEVLMRVDSDQPEDTIADVHRPGYVMAEKVLRPAQVTVSEGDEGSDDAESE